MAGICFRFQKKYFSQAGITLGNLPPTGMHICDVNIGHDIIRRTAMAKIIIVFRIDKATPDQSLTLVNQLLKNLKTLKWEHLKKGISEVLAGKFSTAVGSTWKSLNVLRSNPPSKRRGQPSDLQLQRQAKFTLITNFLTPLTDLLNQTYSKSAASRMSGFNKAFSVNSDAIAGVYPAITVDYPKILLSKGSLPNATSPTAASTAAGKLTFTWIDKQWNKQCTQFGSRFCGGLQ